MCVTLPETVGESADLLDEQEIASMPGAAEAGDVFEWGLPLIRHMRREPPSRSTSRVSQDEHHRRDQHADAATTHDERARRLASAR
jgi:hypothetical protein